MRSIDDIAVGFRVNNGLRAKLTAEEFGWVCKHQDESVQMRRDRHQQETGRPRACAMAAMFTMTVLMPFPLPSTCRG